MNKYVVIALIVSVIAAIAAYRYYGPASTGCGCAHCPCEQVAEEVVVVDVPAEEVVAQDEAVASEKPADCCCGQACADEKHNDVK